MIKRYCLLYVVFLLASTLAHSQKLSPYFVLHSKALSYLIEEKNEKAIYILKEKCLKKYPQDLRSMFLLSYLHDQNKKFDSAYYYLVKMFQSDCGFFVRDISTYEADPLVSKYLDTSTYLKKTYFCALSKVN